MSNIRSSSASRDSGIVDFISLTAESQLDEIALLSNKPRLSGVLLFKHSPRCGVSLQALKQLKKQWDFEPDQFAVYLVNVIENRHISNKIAEVFGVRHESPQLLLIKQSKCVGNASHWKVSVDTIKGWMHA